MVTESTNGSKLRGLNNNSGECFERKKGKDVRQESVT